MEEIYSKTTNPPPLAGGGREIIPSGEYTCKFTYNSSLSHGSGTGNYLVSDTFMTNSEYSWAIYFYPNGKRVERDGNLVSFVIQLESKPNNQQDKALFKLVLVDQSRKRNHKIHIHSGLAHQGCHWEEHGSEEYAKDGFIQVFCWIAIFGLPCISNSEDQNSLFMETLISKETAYSVIINTESLLRPRRSLLFGAYHYKIDEYLKAIDQIQELMKSGMITNYQSEGINVMDMVMKRLQLEFKEILKYPTNKIKNHMNISETSTSYSSSVSSSSYELHDTDSIAHGEFSDQQVIHLCNIIARLKISTGLIGHCIDQYRISRKSVVDQTFSRYRIGKQEFGNIWSLDWEQVMVRMKLGIRAINVCSRIIFPREKKYYEQIFAGIESATYDDCFLTIITDAAMQLCNFAETISTTPVSLQKLFGILDLYKALLLLLPEIKAAFHSSSSVDVYFRTAKIVDRLAELVRHIISTFEDTVFNEQLNTRSGHIIHPLTTYSMDYVIGMIKYEELLAEIIISKPTISLGISDDDMQFLEVGGKTPFALHLVWIFIILKFNLEGKSKQYEDASMGHLFMIKNVKLIVAKIEQHSELQEMIGEDYLTMLRQYVAKKAVTYVEFVRDKALRGLRDEGLNHKFLLFSRISKSALKKRLKIFNAMLDDFFRTRSTWLVPDLQLQGQLAKLMFEELIPAYESFLVKYRSHVESEKYPGKYIKYLPEDLKDELDGKRKVFSTLK